MRKPRLSWLGTVLFATPATALVLGNAVEDSQLFQSPISGVTLNSGEQFGTSVTVLGDIDSDGKTDLLVGSPARTDGGTGRGAVWVLNVDAFDVATLGTRISSGNGGFPSNLLVNGAAFGDAVASLGDLDGDSYREIVVGAPGSSQIWFIDTVSSTGVAARQNSYSPAAATRFGDAIAALGDLKPSDALNEYAIAVGAPLDDDGGTDAGALYVLFLDTTTDPASVGISHSTKIRAGIDVPAAASANFGTSVAEVGDLNADGVTDLAVGASGTGTTSSAGAVRVLLMTASGTVGSSFLVDASSPQLPLAANDEFGSSVAWLGDPAGAGGGVLAVGARKSDIGKSAGNDPGAVWLVTIDYDLTISSGTAIGNATNWTGTLANTVYFGSSLASLGTWPARNAVGGTLPSPIAAVGRPNSGAGGLYILDLAPCPVVSDAPAIYHSPANDGAQSCVTVRQQPGQQPSIYLYIQTGKNVTANPANRCEENLGTGDELCAWDIRLALQGFIAQSFTPDPAIAGAVRTSHLPSSSEVRINWIDPSSPSSPAAGPIRVGTLALTNYSATGTVKVAEGSGAVKSDLGLTAISSRTVYAPEPGRIALLAAGAALLFALTWWRRARERIARLAIALLLITVSPPVRAATSVKAFNVIAQWDGVSPFEISGADGQSNTQYLGSAVLPVGLRAGLTTLLVGDQFNSQRGATFRIFVHPDGGVFQQSGLDSILRIGGPSSGSISGWVGAQPSWVSGMTGFGSALAKLSGPSANGDIVVAVGMPGSPTTGGDTDRVAIVSFHEDGRATLLQMITTPHPTDTSTGFGESVAVVGDLDGDGIQDLVVGAPFDGQNEGGAWLLFLNADYSLKSTLAIDDGFPGLTTNVTGWFGSSVAGLGDLDGNGTPDLAIGAPQDTYGHVYVLFLEPNGASSLRVKANGLIRLGDQGVAGFPFDVSFPSHTNFGFGMGWLGDDTSPPQGGGVLAVGSGDSGANVVKTCGTVFMLRLRPDGTVRRAYQINKDSGVGYTPPPGGMTCPFDTSGSFGSSITKIGDLNGDEIPDLAVGALNARPSGSGGKGAAVILFMQDSDHDGLDENLDNCPTISNAAQEDADGDEIGDLCDNCPALANTAQADIDSDGEGDSCEPVEVQLTTTGTPSAPSWNLSLECGAFNVTQVNGAIVLPAGATNPKTLTLNGASIGAGSGTSGPGLSSPAGVRGDAIYYSALGNGSGGRLCTALDPPTFLGTLTTGAIGGTQLAAAALGSEGVGSPGFGLALARTAAGNVAQADVRLTNGEPLPILKLELGPAVTTASGTRWDVIAKNASAEFHRVTFGLIAPVGTTISQMRWVGCNTTPSGSGARNCTGGTGFGTTTSTTNSFTQGPVASPPGTQLPHTLYVSLVGNRPSQSSQLTFNPVNGPTQVTLGTVELDASPDLEPALTVDGVNSVTANPLQKSDNGVPSPTQLRLIGEFDPAEDLDGDEIQDLSDNCPFTSNPAQTNRGSFLNADDDTDALGDDCQCGESTGDGAILDPADFEQIRDYLSGLVTSPTLAAQIQARCSVAGPTDCNIRDLVFLKKAMDAGATSVPTKCDAALSPATP